MGAIIDIILATVLAGLMLFTVFNANYLVADTTAMHQGNTMVQEMMVSTVQVLEGELRNMGFGVGDTANVVLSATATSIKFVTRIDPNSANVDTIEYYLGPAKEKHFQNDSVKFIHRKLNHGAVQSIGIATRFSLRYFTQGEADTLTFPIDTLDLPSIKLVELTLEVQNPYALFMRDRRMMQPGEKIDMFSSSIWRQTRLASQNLRR